MEKIMFLTKVIVFTGDYDNLDISTQPELPSKEIITPSESEFGDSCDWFSGKWSCKGGDWRRMDDINQDNKSLKKKLVLNDGYALCQMPKSGDEDPRRHQKDELYHSSHNKRLDLPSWAFNPTDEITSKNLSIRGGVKGMMLPVIRINTCVVKDHGSFVSEPRIKSRGKERYPSTSRPSHSHSHSHGHHSKRSSEESVPRRKTTHNHHHNHHHDDLSGKTIMPLNMPKNHLYTKDDLQLPLGDWYYLDGAGHERGPMAFSEIQTLVDQGVVQEHSSVFRKLDKLWVPVNSVNSGNEGSRNIDVDDENKSNSFHDLHPQFIGYTRGKLHELIMKSYKSREFAAAINEVLDPWINLRQPRKEIEKNIVINTKFSRSGIKKNTILLSFLLITLQHQISFESFCPPFVLCFQFSIFISSSYHKWLFQVMDLMEIMN